MLYIEVILSKYFYFCPNTVYYKISNTDDKLGLIGRIATVPFKDKFLNALIVDVFEKPPVSIDGGKIKEIKELLPSEFCISRESIGLIYKITNYYFSVLSKTVGLFIPVKVFNPTKRDLIKQYDQYKKICNFNIIEDSLHKLNQEQKNVFDETLKNDRVLIKGVTGSGKTEIYKYLALDTLKKGRQVLITVPEIALTPQLLNYFKKTFPVEIIGVIHSKITDAEKSIMWHKIKSGSIRFVIGSRSSLFMPFQDLGLICIDEEHEWTYKNDQSPRYRMTKCAEIIGESFGSKIVLGSATPDFNNYYKIFNSQDNKYKLLELKNRVNGKPLPKIELIDLRLEYKKKNYGSISDKLKFEIKEVLKRKEKVILFLNKRGFNSSVICKNCGYSLLCSSCDVSYTYHNPKNGNKKLLCHYCGKIESFLDICPKCNSVNLDTVGVGIQKVEKDVSELFPMAKIFRADSDTIKTKDDLDNLYNMFIRDEIDILIGTQIIAKGLDFDNVTLVGVILADTALHIPDYKSSERTFSLLIQIAGRSGRGKLGAKIIIQTYSPEHSAICHASNYDFQGFFEKEMAYRKECNFPPFKDVIKLSYKDKDREKIQNRVKTLYNHLLDVNKEKKLHWIISNSPALVPRINDYYIWNIIIRGEIDKFENLIDKYLLQDWIIDRDPNMIS